MEIFDGQLPPVAAQRVQRQRESQVAGSLLSAPAAAALRAAGLEPAGEVMGCIVMHLGFNTAGGCGSFNVYQAVSPVITSGRQSGRSRWGFGPYVRALYHAYDTALGRMLAETRALRADGVVGVDLRWSRLDSGARELVALGTAVRHRGTAPVRAQNTPPFCTELSGEDVAKAVLAGWTPLGLAVGVSLAVKHEDATLRWQRSQLTGPGNVEVSGLTDLVHAARTEARQKLGERAGAFGGASGTRQVVISRTDLVVGERPCGQERDYLAEATFVGTTLAYDAPRGARAPVASLSILPLRSPGEARRGTSRAKRRNGLGSDEGAAR